MARIRTPPRGAGVAAPLLIAAGALVAAPTAPAGQEPVGTTMNRLYAPVEIGADITALPASERAALARIVDAARVMDALFLEQVWPGNPTVLMALQDDRSPAGHALLDYFLVKQGGRGRVWRTTGRSSPACRRSRRGPPTTRRTLPATNWRPGSTASPGARGRPPSASSPPSGAAPAASLRAVPYSVRVPGTAGGGGGAPCARRPT